MRGMLDSDKPLMTYAMLLIVVIVAIVGGVCVVTDNYDDDFNRYVDDLTKLALAVAGLGVGRGIVQAGKDLSSRPQTVRANVEVKPEGMPPVGATGGTGSVNDDEEDDYLLEIRASVADEEIDDDLPEPVVAPKKHNGPGTDLHDATGA